MVINHRCGRRIEVDILEMGRRIGDNAGRRDPLLLEIGDRKVARREWI